LEVTFHQNFGTVIVKISSGGQGGGGGFGSQLGGDGGTGDAPVIPLEAVGMFQWIKGKLNCSMFMPPIQAGLFCQVAMGERVAHLSKKAARAELVKAPNFPHHW
jgi:hypothetical protein